MAIADDTGIVSSIDGPLVGINIRGINVRPDVDDEIIDDNVDAAELNGSLDVTNIDVDLLVLSNDESSETVPNVASFMQ